MAKMALRHWPFLPDGIGHSIDCAGRWRQDGSAAGRLSFFATGQVFFLPTVRFRRARWHADQVQDPNAARRGADAQATAPQLP
jgi:hypothetical protein